jgi:hypothetical protein
VTAVYPWRADGPGRASLGVTDDPVRAKRHAADCLEDWAVSAVVEEASLGGLGAQTLAAGYPRTGQSWRGRMDPRGRVRWTSRRAAA